MTKDLKIEPKIGEIITIKGVKYITQLSANCLECALRDKGCWNIVCNQASRKDGKNVTFKKVETNMEVKIQIPDNCELVKNGDTYIVREKEEEDSKPKSWEEFCEKYPKKSEYYIEFYSTIELASIGDRNSLSDRKLCYSYEEAEAFLALMQLRQLRKAWIGDWECPKNGCFSIIEWNRETNDIRYSSANFDNYRVMSFPSSEMALDFMYYFGDLLRKAKVLL